MSNESEPASQEVNRLSYDPPHNYNYRRIDVDAWAHQWFDALAYMDTESKEYETIEQVVASQLAIYPDDRSNDTGDLQHYMGHFQLIGQQNPHDPNAESVAERDQHIAWEQRMVTAMIDARQVVRRTLEQADSYVAFRIEQENAGRDYLTGVLNRRGLARRLNDLYRITDDPERRNIAGEALPAIKLTHIYIDTNRLKWINDNLGHHVGDMVIYELAMKTKELFRSAEAPIVYRQGGDEFGVILGNMTDEQTDALTVRLIRRQLDKIQSEEYRQAVWSVRQELQAVRQSGKKVRVEVRRNGPTEPDTLKGGSVSHTIYINGKAVIKLYDMVTLAIGAKSGFVNNLNDVEQQRGSAEEAMRGAKRVFRGVMGDFPEVPPDS